MTKILSVMLPALLLVSSVAAVDEASAQSAGARYAVLIGGLGGTPEYTQRFGTYLSETRSLLVDRHDFPPDHVFVLAEQAIADRPYVDGLSSAEGIREYIAMLRRRVTPDDHVYLVLFGHGSYDGTNARLNIPRADLDDAEYADLIADLPAGRIVVVNTASASGPFASALSGPNRIVITATASGTERDETVFPSTFIEALRSPEADLDKNGGLSVREAFVFAAREAARSFESAGQLATEHAQLDDDGDGNPSRLDAVEAGDEGDFAALTYIRPPDAQMAVSEAALPILREKEGIEQEIAQLKGRKERMSEDAYYAELESLFVRLALLNEQLDAGLNASERTQ